MKNLLLLAPLALFLLAGCGSDDPVDPGPDKGVVLVRVQPGTLDAPWTVTGPDD